MKSEEFIVGGGITGLSLISQLAYWSPFLLLRVFKSFIVQRSLDPAGQVKVDIKKAYFILHINFQPLKFVGLIHQWRWPFMLSGTIFFDMSGRVELFFWLKLCRTSWQSLIEVYYEEVRSERFTGWEWSYGRHFEVQQTYELETGHARTSSFDPLRGSGLFPQSNSIRLFPSSSENLIDIRSRRIPWLNQFGFRNLQVLLLDLYKCKTC